MRILNSLLSIILLFSTSLACYAGVQVGTTRIIYAEGKKEASVSLDNLDSTPYLIKSWIENNNNAGTHFLVTPPSFVWKGNKKMLSGSLSLMAFCLPIVSHFSFLIRPQSRPVRQMPIVIRCKLQFVPDLSSFSARKD